MEDVTKSLTDFARNSVRLVNKCNKPDSKEFWDVAKRTGLGFFVVGLIGFGVKVIFIPINQIIIGTSSS